MDWIWWWQQQFLNVECLFFGVDVLLFFPTNRSTKIGQGLVQYAQLLILPLLMSCSGPSFNICVVFHFIFNRFCVLTLQFIWRFLHGIAISFQLPISSPNIPNVSVKAASHSKEQKMFWIIFLTIYNPFISATLNQLPIIE